MSRLDEKSNNEILLEVKQLQVEHESLKLSMVKDYDSIEMLKEKMKKEFGKLEEVETRFTEANKIIVRRLKGE
tara:strand:- start:35 stop:253 length:219 start_codon:yes stop_codon:yes gene_type:complete